VDRIYDRRGRTWAYIRQPGVSWSQDETSNSSWLSIYRSNSPSSVSFLSAFFLRVSSGETLLLVFMLPSPPGCFVICARLGFALPRLQTRMKIYPVRVPRLTSVCQTAPVTRFLQVADNRCRTRARVQSFFRNWRWETENTKVFRIVDDLPTCERSYSRLAARRKRSRLIKPLNRARKLA